jgi:outer membrane lipoprotein SlyB
VDTSLRYSALLALLMVSACTTLPTGPSVMVMPGTGRSFDQFRANDAECRQFAFGQVGGATPDQVVVDSGVKSAIVGTAVGAAAGAALGGHNGAGAGAGIGLLVGSVAGVGASEASAYGLQRRYDNAYIQCMYTKGDRVPVSNRFASASNPRTYSSPPPPPANSPPPPPPR